ncbi:hypothetical protein JCGZ_21774 [Jatropha curcas]|uniref:Thiol-disulfide oxidoreductase DCC n=1 Tax=Jatropha curcas TaxID=180498 RepID=A0A067JEX1_JATCU|nr:hypothetical protein JCGZ_21774 [Jatropha curcas]
MFLAKLQYWTATSTPRNAQFFSSSSSFSSSCLLKCSLFSSFSSSSFPFPSPTDIVSDTAAAVADVVPEAEDLLYPDVSISSTVKPVTAPTLLQPRVVVYDGVCHLCHRGVKWVIKADKYRKIKFCCLQSKAAEPYLRLCGLDREDVLRRFLFIEGLGQYHQASTAALRVLAYLPLPYSALSTLLIVPTPLRDAVYDHIARRRYDWFGKAEDCLVLKDKELLERFIDRDEMIDKRRSDK